MNSSETIIPGDLDKLGGGLKKLEKAFLLHLAVLKLVFVHTKRRREAGR